MSDIQKRIAAREALTPESGWNLVVLDDFEPAGEELSLVSWHPTRAEAEKAKRARGAGGSTFLVYGKRDAGEGKPRPTPATLVQKSMPGLVIPAGAVTTSVSPDGSVHGGVGGPNLQVGAPPRPTGGPHDPTGIKEWLRQVQPVTTMIRRDPDVYMFAEPPPDKTFPVSLEDGVQAVAYDHPIENAIEPGALARQALVSAGLPRQEANPGWEPHAGRLPDQDPPPPVEKRRPRRAKPKV